MMSLDEQERRQAELGNAALAALGALQPVRDGCAHWMVAVRCLSELGAAANELIADYYDALTVEELTAGDLHPVELTEVPGGPKAVFQVGLTGEEMTMVRTVAGDGRSVGKILHDAAMAYVNHCDEQGWYGDDAGL